MITKDEPGLTSLQRGIAKKEQFAMVLKEYLPKVEGAVVELGVHKGLGIEILLEALKDAGQKRHIYGFDSWEPFPDLQSPDLIEQSAAIRLTRDHISQTPLLVKAYLINEGYSMNDFTLIKGWIKDSLPSFDKPIALAMVDLDVYVSYKETLPILWPKVSIGGAVFFDEYNSSKWPGCKVAVDEFLMTVPHKLEGGFRWWAQKL